MILLLTGEGPTDIGSPITSEVPASTGEVKWGGMGKIVDVLAERIWQYSPSDTGALIFISENQLGSLSRGIRRGLALPGLDRPQETGYFFKNARALARLAKLTWREQSTPVGAILFRDADGTRSADRSLRADKVNSMTDGFRAEDFDFGVPMVPQPKSEAWLLCALQNQPYQNCSRFESISGNDHSLNPAKVQLEEALSARDLELEDLSCLVADGVIDVHQIDMPSFNEFRDRLFEVLRALQSVPVQPNS